MKPKYFLAAALLATGPTASLAHVVATPTSATAGSYSVVAFRVGHGCKGSPTTALRVAMPADLASARPQPKPGWALNMETGPADSAPDKRRVVAITWTGLLSDDQFDDFAVLMKLPDQPGSLYFPVIQTCQTGQSEWTQIPAEPEMTGLERPAPQVTVVPAPAGAESAHHH